MTTFLMENLATILISLALTAVVAVIIRGMVRNRKTGKTSCGCGCSNCPSSGVCHQKK